MSNIYKIPSIEDFNEPSEGFLWRTMDGEILTLANMSTRHIFNSMKMLFNHLAQEYGGDPVWFTHIYGSYSKPSKREAQKMAETIVFFMDEIDRRGDLHEKYLPPYVAICDQVRARRLEGQERKGIE